jgi:hypothetical protein
LNAGSIPWQESVNMIQGHVFTRMVDGQQNSRRLSESAPFVCLQQQGSEHHHRNSGSDEEQASQQERQRPEQHRLVRRINHWNHSHCIQDSRGDPSDAEQDGQQQKYPRPEELSGLLMFDLFNPVQG